MTTQVSARTVGGLVAASPLLSVVFEKYQIDYCCHGGHTLEEACQARHLDLQEVSAAVAQAEREHVPTCEDWLHMHLEALIQNILAQHHDRLRAEIPRLTGMFAKVERAHGSQHPELAQCQAVFATLCAEIVSHMGKEEQVLFPAIIRLERLAQTQANFGMMQPISQMEEEHTAVGTLLAELRALTGEFTPPADACNTYRVLYFSLEKMEADLHLHIHKENNILFPRAVALEQQRRSGH